MSASRLVPAPAGPSEPRAARAGGPLVWFAGLLALFLTVRAVTTLVMGASFATPGDGWRSLWQLAVVGLLAWGLTRRQHLRPAVAIVSAVYLSAMVLEWFAPDALLGVIPVDMRDRVVHPLVGLLGLAAVLADRRAAAPDPRS